jgi:hypothetical protein
VVNYATGVDVRIAPINTLSRHHQATTGILSHDLQSTTRERGGWAVLALGQVLLPLLYVASAGPAWRLALRGEIDYETYDAVYGILERVSDNWTAIGVAYDQYRQLWTPDDLPPAN